MPMPFMARRCGKSGIRTDDGTRASRTAACIRAGALFIVPNRDPVIPTERGLEPGAGSIIAALATASGVVPLSLGKPGPHLLEEAARAVPINEMFLIIPQGLHAPDQILSSLELFANKVMPNFA